MKTLYIEAIIERMKDKNPSLTDLRFIEFAEKEVLAIKQAAQHLRAGDKCPDCGGSGFMVKIDNRKVSCVYCNGTGICV